MDLDDRVAAQVFKHLKGRTVDRIEFTVKPDGHRTLDVYFKDGTWLQFAHPKGAGDLRLSFPQDEEHRIQDEAARLRGVVRFARASKSETKVRRVA